MPRTEHIESLLKQLPASPGVYFHKGANGEIIYVGKAAVLKNRVRQYFQQSRDRDPKTEALVAEIVDIEWVETESEIDALFLEAELIKRYKPRFNIALKDDRSDIFVRIDSRSEHPTVQVTRRPLDDNAEYFGPFTAGYSVRRALKYLRRIFPYDDKVPKSGRVSLNYHIGLSPGLEEGKTSLKDYRDNLRKLKQYLKGERSQLVKSLRVEMEKAAKAQDFERAASLRNQMHALDALNRQIIFGDSEFMDISKDQALSGLTDLLDLKKTPKRIEGFDISHMQGTDTVASMVVFTNGIPDKREYRKFKMRIPGNDDFIHMHEVISRRFSEKNRAQWADPDLILIDGGKGQLGAARTALSELGLLDKIPAIGLAKRLETIIRQHGDANGADYEEISLPLSSHIIKLLQRIRDESHRFAVSYHSTLKTKRQTVSILDEIPTIGPATKKKLLKEFGSLKGIQQARAIELEKLIGASKTKILRQYLRSQSK